MLSLLFSSLTLLVGFEITSAVCSSRFENRGNQFHEFLFTSLSPLRSLLKRESGSERFIRVVAHDLSKGSASVQKLFDCMPFSLSICEDVGRLHRTRRTSRLRARGLLCVLTKVTSKRDCDGKFKVRGTSKGERYQPAHSSAPSIALSPPSDPESPITASMMAHQGRVKSSDRERDFIQCQRSRDCRLRATAQSQPANLLYPSIAGAEF